MLLGFLKATLRIYTIISVYIKWFVNIYHFNYI